MRILKLKFTKIDDGSINVTFKDDVSEKEFKYVEMIQYLHSKNSFEEPEFSEGISNKDSAKIIEMIEKMNQVIVSK